MEQVQVWVGRHTCTWLCVGKSAPTLSLLLETNWLQLCLCERSLSLVWIFIRLGPMTGKACFSLAHTFQHIIKKHMSSHGNIHVSTLGLDQMGTFLLDDLVNTSHLILVKHDSMLLGTKDHSRSCRHNRVLYIGLLWYREISVNRGEKERDREVL